MEWKLILLCIRQHYIVKLLFVRSFDLSKISLEKVSKSYPTRHGDHWVLKNISFSLQMGERMGILGRNGAGKSTLIRILGGVDEPTTGSLTRTMSISWPLAFTGGFQATLTGMDNLKFVCRIYGVNYREVLPFIRDFSDLGVQLYEPIKTYSSGMLARFAFAVSMSIDFDCYLIDEVIAVGDSRFREKCHHELLEVRGHKSIILVSHDLHSLKEYCDRFGVIHKGEFFEFATLDEAVEFHEHC